MHNALITGGEHADRIQYALEQALLLLCHHRSEGYACKNCINCLRVTSNTHPNIIFIEPPTSNNGDEPSGIIKIDQVRKITVENYKANFEDGIGIFIITHMHMATTAAANALLKVIEENHSQKVFFALAPSKMTVLKTIRSRLVNHSIRPAPLNALSIDTDKCAEILTLSKTPPKARFPFCLKLHGERDELTRELQELRVTCHGMMRTRELSPRAALLIGEALMRAEESLKKNLNPRLVTEHLVLREWPYINP